MTERREKGADLWKGPGVQQQLRLDAGPLPVEVVRSKRRRKTVSAREVDGVLRVSIPATMSKADEDKWVTDMVRRMDRLRRSNEVDLDERVRVLTARHGFKRPTTIRWVDNQTSRWGSCTPVDGSIRISTRAASFPTWVVDYVIAHELAHLEVADHSHRFWAAVARYPLTERARGYLIAKGGDEDG